MCMMCEEEGMYQAYLAYLARKAKTAGATLTPDEQSFLQDSGVQLGGFSCDPAPADETAAVVAPKVS